MNRKLGRYYRPVQESMPGKDGSNPAVNEGQSFQITPPVPANGCTSQADSDLASSISSTEEPRQRRCHAAVATTAVIAAPAGKSAIYQSIAAHAASAAAADVPARKFSFCLDLRHGLANSLHPVR